MSSQGPGWWQATDGRWYPPEQHPDHVPAPPATDASSTPEAPTSGAPAGAWAPPEPEQPSAAPAQPGWASMPPPAGPPPSGPPQPGSVPPGAPPPSWGAPPTPGVGGPTPTPNTSSKKPLIVVLVLFALLVAGGIVAVAALLFFGTAERDDTGTIIDEGSLDVFDLQVGDCFTDDAAAPMTPDETIAVKRIDAIPCDQAHGAEAFANVDLPDGEFPGDAQVSDRAATLCFDEFEPYVGAPYESSEYDYGWFTPTEQTWSNGDRTINCILFRTDGGLSTGSARGSGR